ncbi:MAG: hypothetical protein ACE5HU_05605, partial [Acidobacteriota bacterium]
MQMILMLLVAANPVIFHDVTAESRVTFVHDMGKSGERMMVETMGSGGGFIDFDNDGDLDLYLVNGAPLPGYRPQYGHADFPELVRVGNIRADGRLVSYLNTGGVEWHTD